MVKFSLKSVLSVLLLTAYCSLFIAEAQPTLSQDTVWFKDFEFQFGNGKIGDAQFFKDGSSLAVSIGSYLIFINTATGAITDTFPNLNGLLWFYPDNVHLAISQGSVVKILNVKSKTIEREVSLESSTAYRVGGSVFSPDGSFIAGNDNTLGVFIWDLNTGALIKKIKEDDDCFKDYQIQITSDNKYMFLAEFYECGDPKASYSNVYLYDIRTWSRTQINRWPTAGILNSGEYFISIINGILQLYEVEGIKFIRDINLEGWYPGKLSFSFYYSPDDKFIISTTQEDGIIKIFDIETGKLTNNYQITIDNFSYGFTYARINEKYILGLGIGGPILALFNAIWNVTSIDDKEKPISYVITFPNPILNAINIDFILEKSNFTTIFLVDSIGRQIIIYPEKILELGNYKFYFDLSFYPNGKYTLSIISGQNSFNSSIIINK